MKLMEYVNFLLKWFVSLKIKCFVNLGIYTLSDSHKNVDKSTNKCKLAFLLLLFLHFLNFYLGQKVAGPLYRR